MNGDRQRPPTRPHFLTADEVEAAARRVGIDTQPPPMRAVAQERKMNAILDVVQSLLPVEKKNYSLSKLIALEARRREPGGAGRVNSIEYELDAALAKTLGPHEHPGAVYIPTQGLRAAGANTKTVAAGGALIGVDVVDIVDAMMADSIASKLGAQVVSGLRGQAIWPVETTATAPVSVWADENGNSDCAENDASFSSVSARPKMLTSTTSFSRTLLAQSAAPGIETFLRRRLGRGQAAGIDQAALSGSGLSNEPLGLLSRSDVPVVSLGVNGAVVSVAALHDLEEELANNNAAATSLLTTAAIRKKLRSLPSIASGGVPVWDGNRVLGWDGYVSTHVPSTLSKGSAVGTCHALLAGAWENLIISEFGAAELLVDPLKLRKVGMVEITVYQMIDIVIVRPTAFAVIVDALTS